MQYMKIHQHPLWSANSSAEVFGVSTIAFQTIIANAAAETPFSGKLFPFVKT